MAGDRLRDDLRAHPPRRSTWIIGLLFVLVLVLYLFVRPAEPVSSPAVVVPAQTVTPHPKPSVEPSPTRTPSAAPAPTPRSSPTAKPPAAPAPTGPATTPASPTVKPTPTPAPTEATSPPAGPLVTPPASTPTPTGAAAQ